LRVNTGNYVLPHGGDMHFPIFLQLMQKQKNHDGSSFRQRAERCRLAARLETESIARAH
jgi:hypothetical protein